MNRSEQRKIIKKVFRETLPLAQQISQSPIRKVDLYSKSAAFAYQDSFLSLFSFYNRNDIKMENLDVIDIGVGKGWTSYLLSKFVKSVKGYDLEYSIREHMGLNQIHRWQKLFWDEFLKRNPENLAYDFFDGFHIPAKDQSADLVEAQAVIEHVDNNALTNEKRDEWLKEINRVLKKDGILHISWCPSKFSFSENLAGFLKISHHDKLFRKNELAELIERNGFEIVRLERTHPYIDFFPGILLDIWNVFYLILFRWLEKFWLFTPWRFFFHHFRVIARKK